MNDPKRSTGLKWTFWNHYNPPNQHQKNPTIEEWNGVGRKDHEQDNL
jgi:hypothetical protein